MAITRVKNTVFETSYNPHINKWMLKAYDRTRCYFKARRLREGTYAVFNEVMVKVDYNNAPENAPLNEYPVSIEFFPSCEINREFIDPCV